MTIATAFGKDEAMHVCKHANRHMETERPKHFNFTENWPTPTGHVDVFEENKHRLLELLEEEMNAIFLGLEVLPTPD